MSGKYKNTNKVGMDDVELDDQNPHDLPQNPPQPIPFGVTVDRLVVILNGINRRLYHLETAMHRKWQKEQYKKRKKKEKKSKKGKHGIKISHTIESQLEEMIACELFSYPEMVDDNAINFHPNTDEGPLVRSYKLFLDEFLIEKFNLPADLLDTTIAGLVELNFSPISVKNID
jgi:hypothetical protein